MQSLDAFYQMIGPVGVVLLFVAAYAVYLSVWLTVYLNGVWRNFQANFRDFENGTTLNLKGADKNDNPLIRIIYDIVTLHSAHSNDIRSEVAYLFHRNFKRVGNGLCWLRLISVISPLLGLLGTVFGMVDVFKSISLADVASTELLAAGIWSALITTVMGLCVAIPTLMVYYALTLKFKGFHIEAIEHSYQAIDVCKCRTNASCACESACCGG